MGSHELHQLASNSKQIDGETDHNYHCVEWDTEQKLTTDIIVKQWTQNSSPVKRRQRTVNADTLNEHFSSIF